MKVRGGGRTRRVDKRVDRRLVEVDDRESTAGTCGERISVTPRFQLSRGHEFGEWGQPAL